MVCDMQQERKYLGREEIFINFFFCLVLLWQSEKCGEREIFPPPYRPLTNNAWKKNSLIVMIKAMNIFYSFLYFRFLCSWIKMTNKLNSSQNIHFFSSKELYKCSRLRNAILGHLEHSYIRCNTVTFATQWRITSETIKHFLKCHWEPCAR